MADANSTRSLAEVLSRTAGAGAPLAAGDPGLRPPVLAGAGLPGAERPRWRVGPVLGAGGIGRVLLVEDANLHREVAVKTPLPWLGSDREALAAFVTEARITASLEHPGIVPVHDLDLSADGQIYYAMRRVRGRQLSSFIGQALAEGVRPPEIAGPNDVVTIMLKVCDALAYAHSRDVVHCDLKPDNIMLGGFGEVLVLDWGASSGPAHRADGDAGSGWFGTPAFMSPEQARREPVDARSDVFSLGATLFQLVLLRFPLAAPDVATLVARRRRGEIDAPRPDELDARTRPLAAIALRAMAPDPAGRYPSVAALAADLRAYQSGQAMAAYRGTLGERLARWHRRWGRAVWTAAALLAVVATAGWLLWGERLKQVAAWGPPVIREDFADESWRARWTSGPPAEFAVQNGRLVSQAAYDAVLWSRQVFAGPVAIEFDGEITPGSHPCDLSVAWWNGDLPAGRCGVPAEGWILQAGAYDNNFCALNRAASRRHDLVARSDFRLVPGRTHRIRAEIDGSRLALSVDGAVVLAYEDIFPIQPGHLGIYAYYPGKAFDNLRVYTKGVAERMPPTALGDDHALGRRYPEAIDRYRRVLVSHPTGPLADEAWYKIGHCRQMQGDAAGAWEAWRRVAGARYGDRVACQELDRLFAAGRHDEVLRDLPAVAARSAVTLAQCEGLWTGWVENLRHRPGRPRLEDYLAARQRVFPGHGPSVSAYCRGLMDLRRYEEAIAAGGDDPLTMPDALLHAGRPDEAIARFGSLRWLVGSMRWHAGELEATIADPANDPRLDSRINALAKSGRIAEALRLDGATPRWQLLAAAGDWAALLARPPDGDGDVLARIALGRTAEAAEGRHRQPAAPSRLALLLLGRLAEAEDLGGIANPSTLRLLAALEAGDQARARRLGREVAAATIDWSADNHWFGPLVAAPFAAALAGERGAWDAAAARALEHRPRAGQRLWHLAAFVAGRIDGRTMLAQPFRAEAEAWLRLGEGLRADLAGDRGRARAAYLAFRALPLEKRLLEGFRPSPVVERLVAWRLSATAP